MSENLQAELRKYKEIVEMFSTSVMGGVARMSLDDLHVINATEGYYRMTGYTQEESLLPPFSGCGMNLVLPEDVRKLEVSVDLLIRESKQINVDYRIRKKDGSIAWNSAFCSSVQENENGKYLDVFFLDTTKEKTTELQLSSLLNNMRNGLIRVEVTSKIHVLYANTAFYRQIGFSAREFSARIMGNDYSPLIHSADRDAVQAKMRSLLQSKKAQDSMEFRIITKSNQVRWISASLSKLYDELPGENLLQCLLRDITEERKQAKQSLLNEERFRIISEQTRDVIFDWDVEEDRLRYSPVYEKMFGVMPPESLSKDKLLAGNMFYEEDKPIIRKMIQDITSTHSYAECTVRLRGADGSYFWSQHRVTAIRDENGVTNHVVGIVTDVNDMVVNTLDLRHKAEHDPLTGLINRATGQDKIQRILRAQGDHVCHAFIQFDIDHFKQINDFMGHAAGDFALQRIAQQMRDTFREGDILCRMGGDEFCIFLANPGNAGNVAKKLTLFTKAVNRDLKFEEKIYPLSISMGVALYPNHGKDFEVLYKHADQAMYQNKRKAGTAFSFYTPAKTSEKDVR